MSRPRALATALSLAAIVPGPASASRWEVNASEGFVGAFDGAVVSDDADGLVLGFSGENLLVGPGFESPPEKCSQLADPYRPHAEPTAGWVHNGLAGKEGARRFAAPRSGQRAWELVDTSTPGEPALLQRVAFRPDYRGRAFVFSVWLRTAEGRNDQAKIALKFSTATHWRGDVVRQLVVSPEWKQHFVMAVAPTDADELGVVIGPSSYEGTGAVIADDAFLAPVAHPKSGLFTSAVHDLGEAASAVWRVACRAETPRGTRVELSVRTGKTAAPEASWSSWLRMDDDPSAALRLPPGRYAQLRVRLETSRPEATPILTSAQLLYGARLAFFTGRVTHAQTGLPVPCATVRCGADAVPTDRRGRYLIAAPAGDRAATAAAPHYLATQSSPVRVKEGERVRLDLKLEPDPTWWTFRGDAQRQGYSALSGSLDGLGIAWAYPLGTTGGGQVVPADVDGDGRSEFVMARGGALSAWRLNGDLLWRVEGWELGSILGVYDLLGDGRREVVAVSEGWQPYANGAFTVVSGRDGRVLSRVDTWPDAGNIGHGDTHDYLHGGFSPLMASSSVVADLDGDGKLEIMVHPNYHRALMAFDFHDGLANPKMMWQTQHRFRYDLYLYPLLAADVDGDKRPEIVYHDEALIRIFDGRTGEEKSAADMGCPRGLFGTMACGDVEGDGAAEVVLLPEFYPEYTRHTVALAGWDGKALVRRWSRDFPEPVKARAFSPPLAAPFADVDGDGKLEITVQIGPDVLVLSGLDGAEKHRVPGVTLTEAADLDGDGVAEIVVRQSDRTLVYSGKGGFGRKDVGYPPNWGWRDFGDGDLCRLRGEAGGATEVVNRAGRVKATLPGAPYSTSPIAADLQGDGRVEVLVRRADGLIRVLDASGGSPREALLPDLRCDLPGEMSRGGGITACDLDGDGKAELILRQGGRLVVANADGSVRYRSELGGLWFPAVGDFDGDGRRDVACYAGKRWIVFRGRDGHVLWDAPAPESNEVATADVDGDGCDDLTGKMGSVFLLSGADGHTVWTAFRKEQCALGLGVFADLNGDGRPEAMAIGEYTNTAWYPNGKCLWWIGWSSGGNKEHYGAVADVNGDGALDFIESSNHGVLYCVDGRDARELWTFRIPEKVTLSHCAAADLDGDGKPEIVFGTNTGKLIIVNGENGSLAKEIDFGHPVGEPIIADVNRDHLAEVLVVSNSTLYCLVAHRAARP